jgi:hypothetical protein
MAEGDVLDKYLSAIGASCGDGDKTHARLLRG